LGQSELLSFFLFIFVGFPQMKPEFGDSSIDKDLLHEATRKFSFLKLKWSFYNIRCLDKWNKRIKEFSF
jgi:hypothetical protein